MVEPLTPSHVQLINLTNQGVTLMSSTYHGTVQLTEVTREQLALAVGGTLLLTYTAKRYLNWPTAELNCDNTLKLYLKECSWRTFLIMRGQGDHWEFSDVLSGKWRRVLQVLQEKGVIRPSQSNYASLIVSVCKRSETLCLCMDYYPFSWREGRTCISCRG